MKLIFIGPQASGKGTQAKAVAHHLNVPHISTGDVLRSATGELKSEVDTIMESGALVHDELMLKVLKQRLDQPDCQKGFILDGYPRNQKQAQDLQAITSIDNAVEIAISDQEAIERLTNRRICKECGAIYNTKTNPPKQKNACDTCNAELFKRKDDEEEAIKQRLAIYHKDTKPLVDRYNALSIHGEQAINAITQEILQKLGK